MILSALVLALVVGTWNGNWFPSGRAEHRASDEKESATIAAAGKMLADGLRRADPTGKEPVVLSLCEIRNQAVAERLVRAIGRSDLKVASVSAYRRRDRFDQQQNVILTTLPIAASRWARWRYVPEANPPRGYAYAALVVAPTVTANVYSVHLKSNYGAKSPAVAATNRLQRIHAINQFVDLTKAQKNVILAGDFNADRWRAEFAEECIFTLLGRAGFANLLERLPAGGRATHPHPRYGDSTLDYIVVRDWDVVGAPVIVSAAGISDHHAVFARLKPPRK